MLLDASFLHSELLINMGHFWWYLSVALIASLPGHSMAVGDDSSPHLNPLLSRCASTSFHNQSPCTIRLWQSQLRVCFPPRFKNHSKMLRLGDRTGVGSCSLTVAQGHETNTAV